MPHTKSAKKNLRKAAKRRLRNRAAKRTIKTHCKRVLAAVDEAPEKLREEFILAVRSFFLYSISQDIACCLLQKS